MSVVTARKSPQTRSKNVKPKVLAVSALLMTCLSGDLKGTPLLSWFPVDFTLFSGGLLLLLVIHHWIGRKFTLPPNFGYVVVVWLAFIPGVLVAVGSGNSLMKSMLLFTLTLLCAASPLIIFSDDVTLGRWFIGLAVVATVVAPMLYLFPSVETGGNVGRLNLEGGTSITIARVVAAGALVAVLVGLGSSLGRRLALWLLAAGLAIATVLIGSRGPFLALIAAVVVVVVASPTFRQNRVGKILGSAGLLSLLIVYVLSQSSVSAARLAGTLTGSGTDTARPFLYRTALDSIRTSPLGIGWGGYPHLPDIQLASGSEVIYPHNLLLEVAAEGGWLAIATLLAVLFILFRKTLAKAADLPAAIALGLATFWLVNAMFSSDVNGNRMWWASFGLLCVIAGRTDRGTVDG
ncbi:O-antigen ligase family protein [Oryzobacter telluris]|uniref:O-antigen ligase family protein n=1 Tax=Oryzobacter telluris TaxID=3149179 RepID=UPI00370D6343